MYLGCLFYLFVYVDLFRTNLKRSGLRLFPCTINCQTQVVARMVLRLRTSPPASRMLKSWRPDRMRRRKCATLRTVCCCPLGMVCGH
jgi:hypothetical protein